ncbi:hypothetical protein EBZ35_06330 [bacterium]|nr:hypothetical protein [bacterium]
MPFGFSLGCAAPCWGGYVGADGVRIPIGTVGSCGLPNAVCDVSAVRLKTMGAILDQSDEASADGFLVVDVI